MDNGRIGGWMDGCIGGVFELIKRRRDQIKEEDADEDQKGEIDIAGA